MTGRAWPTDPRFLIEPSGAIWGPSGRPLAPFVGQYGYLRFNRYAAGRWSQHSLHVVVCETFHGPRPPGKWAAHHDGNKLDCSAGNVAWKTKTENEADKVTHGTRAECERHGMHKLTAADVRAIRASSESSTVLATRYPVSAGAIRDARSGRTWGALR